MCEKGEALGDCKLLTKNVLETAVKADLGQEWDLLNYEVQDFTKKGDNFQSLVTKVTCNISSREKQSTTNYIAKLNPLCGLSKSNEEMSKEFFIREGNFLKDVAIELNQILTELNMPRVVFPECVYVNFEKGKELMLTKDLRQKNFTMIDKTVPMDSQQIFLLLKTLARFHASSVVLQKRLSAEKVMSKYPFMYDRWLLPGTQSRENFESFMKDSIDITLKIIQKLKGYDKQCQWLKSIKDKAMDIYTRLLTNAPENVKVIIHGDCWSNNLLFR